MKLRRIFNTTSFRLSSYAVVTLTCSMLLLGLFFLYSVRGSMLAELRFRIQQESEVLLFDYRQDGLNELLHDVRERRETRTANRLYYFLQNRQGKVIFDDLPSIPQPAGWHEIQLEGSEFDILLYSFALEDGYVLAVGASLDNFQTVKSSMLQALLSAILLTTFLGIGCGLLLSWRLLSKIDRVAREAERIGSGNLGERLTRDGSGDDFDQLTATINHMLERIETLHKSVRRVSSNVAHELRTPIGHLKQDLEKLFENELSPEDCRKIAKNSLERIDGILKTFAALLRISELEAGELKSHFQEVNLGALLKELVDIYQPVAEAGDHTLSFHSEEEMTCHGDRRLLLQLFSNLIENALRHGGKNVAIDLVLRSEGNQTIVSVSDSGCGMDQTRKELVQRKLYDLEDGSVEILSSGVGLVLVGAIARLHDAIVEIWDGKPGVKILVKFPCVSQ